MASKKKIPTQKPAPPSLDELFDRIKLEYTVEEREALIERLREERQSWQEKQEKKHDAKAS